MIYESIILSLQITALWLLFQEGMILGWLRIICANALDLVFDKKWSRYLQKPMWGCLPCMASVWTIVLSWHFDLKQILIVCAMNAFINRLFFHETDA